MVVGCSMNNELDRIENEALMALFDVLSRHLAGGLEE
jgi:hypothetical protein